MTINVEFEDIEEAATAHDLSIEQVKEILQMIVGDVFIIGGIDDTR